MYLDQKAIDEVSAVVSGQPYIIIRELLGKLDVSQTVRNTRRAGWIMRALGWDCRTMKCAGKTLRCWVNPAAMPRLNSRGWEMPGKSVTGL